MARTGAAHGLTLIETLAALLILSLAAMSGLALLQRSGDDPRPTIIRIHAALDRARLIAVTSGGASITPEDHGRALRLRAGAVDGDQRMGSPRAVLSLARPWHIELVTEDGAGGEEGILAFDHRGRSADVVIVVRRDDAVAAQLRWLGISGQLIIDDRALGRDGEVAP
ncbi:MAG: prepilin-type N-terminal cleavage/methylation domain-containing protein [Phycisphaerales bacterium]